MTKDEIKIGMELEAWEPPYKRQCLTDVPWYPAKVLRPLANSPGLFWVKITYPDKTTAEHLRSPVELRTPT